MPNPLWKARRERLRVLSGCPEWPRTKEEQNKKLGGYIALLKVSATKPLAPAWNTSSLPEKRPKCVSQPFATSRGRWSIVPGRLCRSLAVLATPAPARARRPDFSGVQAIIQLFRV